jgi:AcrR family transcriptional regulator
MPQRASSPAAAAPSQPPGRRNAARRSQQILAAAFEEFAANGYEATRLDDVAERARIAKGTIYLHFSSKDVLFRAVVRGLIRPVFEGFDAHVESFTGSAGELLCELLSRIYEEVVRNEKARGVLRLLIAESGKFPQLAGIYRREVIEPGMRAMRLTLERGVASGEFRETKLAEFPQILVAPAILAAVWMLILGEREPLDLNGYLQVHLEFVTAGLRVAGAGVTRERGFKI